jgi:polar amino acid transport system permease protein
MTLDPLDSSRVRSQSKAVQVLLILVAVTAVLSLLYGIQYFLGGPVRLSIVSPMYALDLSPDSRLIAAGDKDGRVRVWSVPTDIRAGVDRDFDVSKEQPWDAETLPGPGGAVLQVRYAPDGSTLTAVTSEGNVRSWTAGGDQIQQDFSIGGASLIAAHLASNGQTLAVLGEDGLVRVWDLQAQQESASFGPTDGETLAVALNRDGTLVAAGDGLGAQVWDVQTGELVARIAPYCEDGTSTTQEACEDADEDWLGHDEEVTALAFGPSPPGGGTDGQLLATGSADTTIIFWDLATVEAKWSSVGHWATVTAMVFDEAGELLLSGGKDYKIRDIRVIGGKSTAYYEGHLNTVNGAAYGPQEGLIVTVSEDGTLRVWERANQYTVHLEWSKLGLQPTWGRLFGIWMLISGILALVSLWGLARIRIWGHLLALGLFLLGPIIVLGLPLLEVLTYPLQWGTKLQVAWPLLVLVAWYVAVYVVLTWEPVALTYETYRVASLADQIMVSRRTKKTRLGIYGLAVWIVLLVVLYSILRRFNLDIAFMGNFLRFIMLGSGITFYVSALSILLAVIMALLGALGRLSKNPIANSISGFYISLIRGTPLLVQIYIWYLGLPRLDIVLDPRVAGVLALGVNYGAYMTEIFRAGIQAVSIGQREASQALGMNGLQTFRRIILPQAFRIVIPPIGNQFIAMMKDSSLVSIMAVQELTWRANKIGRQYFRGMETFIIAAAFYWILTVIFQMFQGRLEEYMARGERR